ncbi:hypothetical protein AX15_001357 [Amanita polypyramis BW_CC]|nr:hypothetical protein AX15_001357 [Amanita polypyramis BW_CC]
MICSGDSEESILALGKNSRFERILSHRVGELKLGKGETAVLTRRGWPEAATGLRKRRKGMDMPVGEMTEGDAGIWRRGSRFELHKSKSMHMVRGGSNPSIHSRDNLRYLYSEGNHREGDVPTRTGKAPLLHERDKSKVNSRSHGPVAAGGCPSPQPTMLSLLTVPNEILAHIAFYLATLSLHALPDALLPLRYSCKYLHFRLSPTVNLPLYARICRFKFDNSAVRRKAFVPAAGNLVDHLDHCCKLMAAIRNRNFEDDDPSSVLFSTYILMLENDGKNRAQLEWAGVDAYVDAYVRTRIYDPVERMANDGWPRDNAANACALWLLWMLTTPDKLQAESLAERDQIAQCVLPYVSLPFRYASTHAPPIHYNLPPPCPTSSADDKNFFSISTAHGLFPIYFSPDRAWSHVYYGSRPLFAPPLAAEAAKLIYQSRRDMAILPVPAEHPRTRADAIAAGATGVFPTQEDIQEVNAHKSAELVKRIIWDWDRGVGVVPGANDGMGYLDASRSWDCDWWRLRFCWDLWRSQPRWRPGKVYMPGTLSGLWQGKMLIPSEVHMMAFLNAPIYPSPIYSEATLLMTIRPIYMRLTEHHCLIRQTRMPVPQQENAQFQDNGVKNAWFPGPTGSMTFKSAIDHREGCQNVTLYATTGQIAEYRTYNPKSSGSEWSGYEHDQDSCPGCKARAELVDSAAQEELSEVMEEEKQRRREAEKAFTSVGLGQQMAIPFNLGDQEMNVDGWEDDDEYSGWDVMEAGEEDEDLYSDSMPPVRRSHDWVRNVVECDGVRDIIVTGSTDETHGQAWHHYTYYGRIRPWDGLIGILSVPRTSVDGTKMIYGYISGGKNFSGNWRWSMADPAMPAWECAVVMSKREE